MQGMMRRLLLSATYRQSSDSRPEILKADPDNYLLGNYPRQRLTAEQIRDQALYVSGLLIEKLGGPSVKPPQPDGLWNAVAYTDSNTARFVQDEGKDKVHRRSLYTFWKRTGPAPVMMALDASKRDVCSVKRERTSTPLQALVLLNDPQLNEAARVLGEKMLVKHGKEKEAMLAEMFRLVTSRKARERELAVLERIYTEQQEHFRGDAAAAQKFLAVGDAKRDSKLAVEDAAAAGVVAATLFNLWESLAAY